MIAVVISIMLICLSGLASTCYRGMGHDEGLGSFRKAGLRIIERQPLFDKKADIGDAKDPARLVYIAFIALGYKLVGITLTALHLFPFLFQLLNPWLCFLLLYSVYRNIWWGLAGALLFLVHPFNLVYLNQQHNHPFFVFFLLVISLVFPYTVKHPKFLALFGCLASLLILTRFEDGMFFVLFLYGVYLVSCRKSGIPWRWLAVSLITLFLTHVLAAVLFDFPLLYPFDYVAELSQRQTTYGARYSAWQATKMVLQYYVYWYFGGKFIAPFLLGFLAVGTIEQIRSGRWYPVAIFWPYFFFLIFVYNGRFEIINLPVTTFTVIGFLWLVLRGMRTVGIWAERVIRKTVPLLLQRLEKLWGRRMLPRAASVVTNIVLLGFFLKSAYALAVIVEDGQPASTLWRIVKSSPPLPGHPAYQKTFVPLNHEERFPVRLREELFRAVRGEYRSWFLHTIGEHAFEHQLPEKAWEQADFSYRDEYESKNRWEQDRLFFEGSSPLWNERYAGRLGAFPGGAEASFVYRFDIPHPIDTVTISDIHTQWGVGDRVKMWTSTDGEQWTLRHDNWNVYYTKDYYYRFFDDEFDGQTSVFVKYSLKAGDKTRAADDNRGASLQEFTIAVNYKR